MHMLMCVYTCVSLYVFLPVYVCVGGGTTGGSDNMADICETKINTGGGLGEGQTLLPYPEAGE